MFKPRKGSLIRGRQVMDPPSSLEVGFRGENTALALLPVPLTSLPWVFFTLSAYCRRLNLFTPKLVVKY
jgi:hypothetical protein